MSFRPGEPLTHEDVVFAEELGGATALSAAITFFALILV